MKLIVNNETLQAEKIVKKDLNIIGYDINNNEIFSFKGILDFSGFQLQDDNDNIIDFPPLEKTEVVLLQEQLAISQENQASQNQMLSDFMDYAFESLVV